MQNIAIAEQAELGFDLFIKLSKKNGKKKISDVDEVIFDENESEVLSRHSFLEVLENGNGWRWVIEFKFHNDFADYAHRVVLYKGF